MTVRPSHSVRLALLLAVIMAAASCTHLVAVPPENYGNPGRSSRYYIVTRAGDFYATGTYSATDSTLTILTLDAKHSVPRSTTVLPAVPFTIPRSNVFYVEKEKSSHAWLPVLVFSVIVAMILISAFWHPSVY